MSTPSNSSNGSSGIHIPDEDADRLLEQRLHRLSSPAIRVSLPPPSSEQLATRLAKLNPQANQPIPEEEELRRRFERLHGGGGHIGLGSSNSSITSVPTYSAQDIQLAGHHPSQPQNEQHEIDQLMNQLQQQQQLEQHNYQQLHSSPASSHPSSLAISTSNSLPSSSSKSPAPLDNSPPPPSRAEIEALMRELQTLPDTEILAQAHRMTDAHAQVSRHRQQQPPMGLDMDDSDEDDVNDEDEVNSIISQAVDEARMGL